MRSMVPALQTPHSSPQTYLSQDWDFLGLLPYPPVLAMQYTLLSHRKQRKPKRDQNILPSNLNGRRLGLGSGGAGCTQR